MFFSLFSFFVHYIMPICSGRGCAPVTRLAPCSANMQCGFVLLFLCSCFSLFYFFKKHDVSVIGFQTECYSPINLTSSASIWQKYRDFPLFAHTVRSGGLGRAALISPSHALRHCLTKWSPLSAVLLFKRGGESIWSLKESAEWKPLHVNQHTRAPHRNN